MCALNTIAVRIGRIVGCIVFLLCMTSPSLASGLEDLRRYAYVRTDSPSVLVIDMKSDKAVDEIRFEDTPRAIYVIEEEKLLLSVSTSGRQIEVYDLAAGRIVSPIYVGSQIGLFQYNAKSGVVAVADVETGRVTLVDLRRRAVLGQVEGFEGVSSIGFDRTGEELLVTRRSSPSISVIDVKRAQVVQAFSVRPEGMRRDRNPGLRSLDKTPNGRFALAIAENSPNVSVVDLGAKDVVKDIRIGKLNQTIVVDNRGGANGLIGSNNIAKSEPDGYSLLLGSVGPLAINPSLYSNVPYNAVTDFASVSLVAQVPLVLLVNPQLGVNLMAELIARAKAKPGSMTYGSAGNGSTQHLAMEMFKSMSGTDIQHIPYKGEAPSVVDLLAGRIDIMIALLPPIYSQIEAGKLKPLAVSTLKRVAALPDVPTADEQGLKGFEVVSWMGLFAPAGTPKPIVDKLNSALASFADDAEVKDKFDRVGGVIPMKSTPEELHNVLKTDIEKWARIVKAANVSMN